MIVCHCIVNRVLVKVREIIDIEKLADTKILIDADAKLPYFINLKCCDISDICD